VWPLGSDPTSAGEVGKTQQIKCCQLLAKLSGQSGGKIRQLKKKSDSLLNLTFLKAFGLIYDEILLSVSTCLGKYNNSLICTELERVRGEKLIFKKFRTFSALSAPNRPKIRPQFCPAALLFIGPF
jgi:hypothetical protein